MRRIHLIAITLLVFAIRAIGQITSSPVLPTAVAGQPYSFLFTATNLLPNSFSQFGGDSLPNGLSLAGSGLLSGTLFNSGTYSFVVTAEGSAGQPYSQIVSLPVISQLFVVNPSFQEAYVGFPFSYPTIGNSDPPLQWSVDGGSLPPGLTESNGTISGTYTDPGIYNFTLVVTDATGASLTIPIVQSVSTKWAVPGNFPTIRQGLAYAFPLIVDGGQPPFHFLTSQMCQLLVVDPTGIVTGEAPVCDSQQQLVFSDSLGIIINTGVYLNFAPGGGAVSGTTLHTITQQVSGFYLPAPAGDPPYSWSGPVPAGFTLDSTDGVIQGSAMQPGTFQFSIDSTNGSGQAQTTTYSLQVDSNSMTIDTASFDPIVINQIPSLAVQLTGAQAPVDVEPDNDSQWNSQPSSSAVAMLLAPAQPIPGIYPLPLTVTDSAGHLAQRTIPLPVLASALHLNPVTINGNGLFATYALALEAYGGVPPYTFSVPVPGTLPPGLALDSAGNLTGSPTEAGEFAFLVQVQDTTGTIDQEVILAQIAGDANPFGYNAIPTGLAGEPYSASVLTANINEPFLVSAAGELPTGFTLDSNGTLHGLPVAPGYYFLNLSATDVNGQIWTSLSSLIIGPNPVEPFRTLSSITAGTSFSIVLPSSLTSVSAWTAGPSSLPAGVSFDAATGTLSGTPTTPGLYGLVATASGPNRTIDTAVYSFYTVTDGSLTITPATLPLIVDSRLPIQLTGEGGVPPYVFASPNEIGAVTASGRLTSLQHFPATITVTDSQGRTGTVTYTPDFQNLEVIVPTAPITATAGQAMSYQLTISGGIPPYRFGPLNIAGLAISPTGLLTGIPQQAGSFTLIGLFTEAEGSDNPFEVNLPLDIQAQGLTIGSRSLPGAHPNVAYSAALYASGGEPPYSWGGGPLPTGLRLLPTGIITGTPGAAETVTIPITVTDSTGNLSGANIQLVIDPSIPAIAPGGVTNGAGYQDLTISPGEIVTLFGGGLGPASGLGNLPANGFYPVSLAGTSVLFDGIAAPLLFVQDSQVSAIVPYGVANRTTSAVTVVRNGIQSAPAYVSVAPVTPALFTAGSSGAGPVAALNQDLTVNSQANPAASGSIVVLYATGTGVTFPASTDGSLAALTPPLPSPANAIGVLIGSIPVPVLYQGVAPGETTSVTQINVRLPDELPPGPISVELTQQPAVATVISQPGTVIYVQ